MVMDHAYLHGTDFNIARDSGARFPSKRTRQHRDLSSLVGSCCECVLHTLQDDVRGLDRGGGADHNELIAPHHHLVEP